MRNVISLNAKQAVQPVNSKALRKARARVNLDIAYTAYIDSLLCQELDTCDIVHEINEKLQRAVSNDALDYIMLSVSDTVG